MSELLMTVLRLSLHASIVAAAVILLRLVLKKAPRAMIVALWGLVALRLILPFTVEFKHSAVPEAIGTGQILEEWSDRTVGQTRTVYAGHTDYMDARKSGAEPQRDSEGRYYVVVDEDGVSLPKTVKTDVLPLLVGIWLAGVAGMLIYMAYSYGRLHKLTARAVRERENIYRSEAIGAPFLLGVLRPRICLPVGLGEPELGYVLAHEKAHIARGDHWWKAIGFWVLCVQWFNPVLWLGYWLFCKDIELACDEAVARKLTREQLADYSQALLNCSLHQKRSLPCPLAFGEMSVKERVKKILTYRKAGVAICVAAVLAACACAVFLMTGSGREVPPVTEPPVESTAPTVQVQKDNSLWLTEPEYPGAEEFFKTDRAVKTGENSCSWQAGGKIYTLIHDPHSQNPNWFGNTLSVRGSDGSEFPMVAISARLENAMLLGCDGRYAYLCEPWSGTFGERILCLDLKTRQWETVVEGDILRQIVMPEKGLMYYLDCIGNDVRVCRVYLPEKKVEILAEMENVVAGSLRLYPPETLLGSPDVLWEGEVREPERPADLQSSAGDPKRHWLTEPQYPDSGQYLYGEQRALKSKENNWGWTVQRDGKMISYTLFYEENSAGSLGIRDSSGNVYENVYVSDTLANSELLSCDGRFLTYCAYEGDETFASRVIRVDLKTGKAETVAQADKIWDIYVFEDLLMYYLTENEADMANIRVNRMYLPTGETREYYSIFGDPWRVKLVPPTALWEEPEYWMDPEPVLVPSQWELSPDWVQDPQRPWLTEFVYPEHYVDYYKFDRLYDTGMDPVSWQIGEAVYSLLHEGSSLSVRCSDGSVYGKIFTSDTLSGGRLLCCDGRYAWFCEAWDGGESYRRISRVDLKTGRRQIMAEADKVWDVWVMEGMVLYYLTYDGEQVKVCEMYLPEAEERVKYTMYLPERLETEKGTVPVVPEMVVLTPPESRNGNPSWELTAGGEQ